MTMFIDTSAFIALVNGEDRYHTKALDQWQSLLAGNESLVCNNYIVIETIALTQNRFGLEIARRVHDELVPLLTISWVDKIVHEQAVVALLAARRRHLSLVDCSAMATMRALGINRVFTFDPHFAEYGFDKLPQ